VWILLRVLLRRFNVASCVYVTKLTAQWKPRRIFIHAALEFPATTRSYWPLDLRARQVIDHPRDFHFSFMCISLFDDAVTCETVQHWIKYGEILAMNWYGVYVATAERNLRQNDNVMKIHFKLTSNIKFPSKILCVVHSTFRAIFPKHLSVCDKHLVLISLKQK
jgi:hypothetical protein